MGSRKHNKSFKVPLWRAKLTNHLTCANARIHTDILCVRWLNGEQLSLTLGPFEVAINEGRNLTRVGVVIGVIAPFAQRRPHHENLVFKLGAGFASHQMELQGHPVRKLQRTVFACNQKCSCFLTGSPEDSAHKVILGDQA